MASTIHDVARLAGVNSSTVSRMLNDKATLTDETRERIYSAMRQLDYHPNSVARNLASGLSRAIGVIIDAESVDPFSNVFMSRSLLAIEQVAQTHEYNVVIASGGKRAAQVIQALIQERKVDGLVIPPTTSNRALLTKIGDFPCVFIGQSEYAKKDASWVDYNNEQGAELAAWHLQQKGYKHIAYLGGDQRNSFVKQRIKGYQKAVPSECAALIYPTNGTTEDAIHVSGTLIDSLTPPEAIICNDNLVAYGLISACKARGISVPDQLGIVTFDNQPLAEYMDPPLTAVDINTALLGEQAAQLLFKRIERKTPNQQILLSAALIERKSSDRM